MSIEKEIFDAEKNKAIVKKNSVSMYSEDWVECHENSLNVGDIVFVEYFPDSQKHLYTHYPEYGTVQEIKEFTYESPTDNQLVKELSIIILNYNGDLIDLNKDHLSIYSRGYYMFITKYVLNHPKTPNAIEYIDCPTCGQDHDCVHFL